MGKTLHLAIWILSCIVFIIGMFFGIALLSSGYIFLIILGILIMFLVIYMIGMEIYFWFLER